MHFNIWCAMIREKWWPKNEVRLIIVDPFVSGSLPSLIIILVTLIQPMVSQNQPNIFLYHLTISLSKMSETFS